MPARGMLPFTNLLQSLRSSRRGGDDETEDERRPYSRTRHATADFTEADDDDEDEDDDDEANDHDDSPNDEDHGGRRPSGTVLPLFSESHLDSLPVYNVTHTIRMIVQSRTETALTWDQLRSPQVSQFLVKPMQQQIRTQHFSRATIYALMANCLQFAKEGQLNPGNAGTSSTRAKVCELLAIKLLKDYTTRELIDALSYDFYPLQGMPGAPELVFWFWSAGFMMDELVGFTEQGFSLYIMSFWNIFDLGILLLLIIYYCMRIYTVFLVDSHHGIDAYDVLAANAVLLLPRIFSVLDHYPYFSQILLAMRIMSVDLAAVFVLIFISCSGFFVFFLTNTKADAPEVAYKIFQILMGFTPAAWDVWPSYTWLDRTLMVLFLIICHFVVVTILITVLTNSFMSIASNAKEEHQFLFAINTIAMVKDQSLFSYVAPGNIFAWMLMPFRYFMPLRHFVWLNRTIIKITHFPLLFCIFLYEKYILSPSMFEPTDFVEHPERSRARALSMNPVGRSSLFSPTIRIREGSRMHERKRTQNAVRNWMDRNETIPESPNNFSTIDGRAQKDWQRNLNGSKERTPVRLRHLSEVRSIMSDPAELMSTVDGGLDGVDRRDHVERRILKDQDADDELVTNDEDEDEAATVPSRRSITRSRVEDDDDYFTTPIATRFNNRIISTSLGKTRRMSSSDLLDVQSDLAGVGADDAFGGVPSSFVTQMAMATGMITPGGPRVNDKAQRDRDNDRDRMSRLVLARMKTLEEGFSDMVKEMRGLQRSSAMPSTARNSASEGGSIVWDGEGDGVRTPYTIFETAGRNGAATGGTRTSGRGSKANSVGKASGSRPGSRREGNKSNRNSVILRSPVESTFGGDYKGKGKEVEMRRHNEESDSDSRAEADVERPSITRKGSSY
ncbi:putative integral membrane channel protein [Diaporthe ampelina]|uniref:Putative integral membrane channel protein n=1 Tax=Diaporthe ampelina TaxID=1214573 RepID=A0A0G2HHU5_9PEZI|nr:putative integral membrane channel protein [Diaporthe ampelina]